MFALEPVFPFPSWCAPSPRTVIWEVTGQLYPRTCFTVGKIGALKVPGAVGTGLVVSMDALRSSQLPCAIVQMSKSVCCQGLWPGNGGRSSGKDLQRSQ